MPLVPRCGPGIGRRLVTDLAEKAPSARTAHSAVFTRIDGTDQMMVWGGQDSSMTPFANTGGLWKRSTNQWTATTTDGAPTEREGHPAI